MLIIGTGLVGAPQGGLGYTLFSITMTIGRLSGDGIVTRAGDRRVLIWGGLIAVAGFVMLLAVPLAPVAMAGFLLIGLGASNIVPVLFSLAGRQSKMPATLAVSAITITAYAGVLVGPAGVGFLSHAVGLKAAFWFLAALMTLIPLFAARATKL